MVETELQKYALHLLKKKYRISEIIDILVKAGHLPHLSKKAVFNACEELYHVLLHDIRMRLSDGETFDVIKKHLIGSGEDPVIIHELLHYVSLNASLYHKLALSETVHKEKSWMADWFRIYLIFFLILFTIFTILTLLLMTHEPEQNQLTISERVALCTAFTSKDGSSYDLYRAVCLAIVSKTPEVCHNSLSLINTTSSIVSTENCLDLSRLLLYYSTHTRTWCSAIDGNNLEELCYQIDEKYCINYSLYNHYCNAVTFNSLSSCSSSGNNFPFELSCTDNYYLHSALTGVSTKTIYKPTISGKEISDKEYWCSKMSSKLMQQFCTAIA